MCPGGNLPQSRAGCPSRRGKVIAFGQDAAAARLRHLERAIDPALADQRVHVGLVEEDQPRQERQLVVRLEQLRSGLLDRIERCFEMRRRLVRSRSCHRHVRKPGVRRPAHAGIRRAIAKRLLEQARRFVQLAAPFRNLRRVQGVEHEVAGVARFLQRLRLVVEARRCVPLAEIDVGGGEVARPQRSIRLQVRFLRDRQRLTAGTAVPRVSHPSK